ncbi:hypothetical protein KCG48_11560 [Proteiniclasticum sp. BAD-10]|uniref:Uncharacterized protein n=1 Tax=Proteiniclasticum sediminis TaxID=2804028 RepID=A0A941CQQ5_9CLOT|nr:hypothetical protein [Proteiniclasticum sediminis]MBR0576952.1 hypothetical protein [Proteiniclasticum sediminis]
MKKTIMDQVYTDESRNILNAGRVFDTSSMTWLGKLLSQKESKDDVQVHGNLALERELYLERTLNFR